MLRKSLETFDYAFDYRELNTKTKKDAYPLPLPDEVQGHMAGATIFSTLDLRQHKGHLNVGFQKLQGAGLTLRGKKCHIGMDNVFYLGHTFLGAGMMPDPGKVKVVEEWPTPHVHSVRQFLGLASYYRRYVNAFAAIAAPLHFLTQKDTPFNWTTECDAAFQTLKQIFAGPSTGLP
ncbi:hypothetical protein EMCRGX_G010004 [Ephydatia muelleri]